VDQELLTNPKQLRIVVVNVIPGANQIPQENHLSQVTEKPIK
jgi:hypothetical protein